MNCFQYTAQCYDKQAMQAKYKAWFADNGDAYSDTSVLKVLTNTGIFEEKTADFKAGRYKLRCGDVVHRTGHCGRATGAGTEVAQYGYPGNLLPDANLVHDFQAKVGQRISQLLNSGKLSAADAPALSGGALSDPTNVSEGARHERVIFRLRSLTTALQISHDDIAKYENAWEHMAVAARDTPGRPVDIQGENTVSLDDLKMNRSDDDYRIFSPKDPSLVKPGCCLHASLYWETKPGLESDGLHFIHIKSTPDGAYHDTHFKLSWTDERGPHIQEWDASVLYREAARAYTGLLKNGFLPDLLIPAGNAESQVAAAERASDLEFAVPPDGVR